MRTLHRLGCWAWGAAFIAHLDQFLAKGNNLGWLLFAAAFSVLIVFVVD